ncbi:hypothetical protein EPN42_04665 [bacterium]|nr:MAG: hypothetical protein EPN42_04665 [bacterium]
MTILDDRERSAVLAGLRLLQEQDSIPTSVYEIATDAGPALTSDEIDDLCERVSADTVVTVARTVGIYIRGGSLQAVRADAPVGVTLVDYDNIAALENDTTPDAQEELREYREREALVDALPLGVW